MVNVNHFIFVVFSYHQEIHGRSAGAGTSSQPPAGWNYSCHAVVVVLFWNHCMNFLDEHMWYFEAICHDDNSGLLEGWNPVLVWLLGDNSNSEEIYAAKKGK